MSPAFTFFIGLLFLVLFGWYFATDYGLRKRLIATLLAVLLVAFSVATIWPPEKNIALGLDIKGGTSFLIKLQQVDKDKPITPGLLDQAVEVIRKRVDYRSFHRKRSAWSRQCSGESAANASKHRRRTQRIPNAWSRFDSRQHPGRSCRSGHYAGMRCGLLSLCRHHCVHGAAGEHRVALRRADHVPLCSDVAGHCRNYFDNRPRGRCQCFGLRALA